MVYFTQKGRYEDGLNDVGWMDSFFMGWIMLYLFYDKGEAVLICIPYFLGAVLSFIGFFVMWWKKYKEIIKIK